MSLLQMLMADEGVEVALELPLNFLLSGKLGKGYIVEHVEPVGFVAVPTAHYSR